MLISKHIKSYLRVSLSIDFVHIEGQFVRAKEAARYLII